jgi:hypothetical protein
MIIVPYSDGFLRAGKPAFCFAFLLLVYTLAGIKKDLFRAIRKCFCDGATRRPARASASRTITETSRGSKPKLIAQELRQFFARV